MQEQHSLNHTDKVKAIEKITTYVKIDKDKEERSTISMGIAK